MICTPLLMVTASAALVIKDQMAKVTHMLMAAILMMSCVGLTLRRDSKKGLAYVI